jgi:hypothetical protein
MFTPDLFLMAPPADSRPEVTPNAYVVAVTNEGDIFIYEDDGAGTLDQVGTYDIQLDATSTPSMGLEGRYNQLAIKNGYLYHPVSGDSTIYVYDIADPTNITLAGSTGSLSGLGGSVAIHPDYDWLVSVDYSNKLTCYDVSDFNSISQIASISYSTVSPQSLSPSTQVNIVPNATTYGTVFWSVDRTALAYRFNSDGTLSYEEDTDLVQDTLYAQSFSITEFIHSNCGSRSSTSGSTQMISTVGDNNICFISRVGSNSITEVTSETAVFDDARGAADLGPYLPNYDASDEAAWVVGATDDDSLVIIGRPSSAGAYDIYGETGADSRINGVYAVVAYDEFVYAFGYNQARVTKWEWTAKGTLTYRAQNGTNLAITLGIGVYQ